MRAEFWIGHQAIDAADVKKSLISTFGPEDAQAVADSAIFSAAKWQNIVLYARQDPAYRIICFGSRTDQLQAHVESTEGNLLQAAESVWRGAQKVFHDKKPTLDVKLVDGETNRELLVGRTGVATELKRKENLTPILIATAIAVYAAIGALTFASSDPGKFVMGAVAGVVGGLVALGMAFKEAKNGVIRWV